MRVCACVCITESASAASALTTMRPTSCPSSLSARPRCWYVKLLFSKKKYYPGASVPVRATDVTCARACCGLYAASRVWARCDVGGEEEEEEEEDLFVFNDTIEGN